MKDQATGLREMMKFVVAEPIAFEQDPVARVIAVASGKGGVGKSNFCVNFALALSEAEYRPIVIDTDVGFSNVEVLLGSRPTYTILDVLNGVSIWDVVQQSPWGLPFLSAGQGLTDIHSLSQEDVECLIGALSQLQEQYDILLLDSGAGMGSHVGRLVAAADELVLVMTPEPTSIADAYAMLKMLSNRGGLPATQLVVNRVPDIAAGRIAASKLQIVTERFLQVKTSVLGYIFEDDAVVRSVMKQEPLYFAYPNSRASKCFGQVVRNYSRVSGEVIQDPSGVRGFLSRLFKRNPDMGGGSDFTHPA